MLLRAVLPGPSLPLLGPVFLSSTGSLLRGSPMCWDTVIMEARTALEVKAYCRERQSGPSLKKGDCGEVERWAGLCLAAGVPLGAPAKWNHGCFHSFICQSAFGICCKGLRKFRGWEIAHSIEGRGPGFKPPSLHRCTMNNTRQVP